MNRLVECACGCGEKFWLYDPNRKSTDHRIRRFVNGHAYASGRGQKGYFYSKKNNKSLWYRSSYEKMAYQILEQIPTVKNYFVEPANLGIFYGFKGKKRNYRPDILVEYTDGNFNIIEVKPASLVEWPRNRMKIEAGKRYAQQHNMKFEVWSEDALFGMRVNSGKSQRDNPEPSRVESRKVQRLLEEDTSSLITSKSALPEREKIVRSV